MTNKAHRFVGLDKDVWLPDDITVEIAIVPSRMTNVRSNQYEVGQTHYCQHETANFNTGANADMHKRWLHGGASGSYVGFNFVVDDKKIIQLTPLNEVTWAAGTPSGNRYWYHTELCVNSDINHTKARRNAAALAAGICAAKGWGKERVVQHNLAYGKDCPYLLRREGRWPIFVNQIGDFITEAKKGKGGSATTPTPSAPPKATIFDGSKDVIINGIHFHADKRTVTITADTNVRQYAGTGSKILRTLPAGSKVAVLGWVEGESVAGIKKWWVIAGGRMWSGTTK